MSVVALCVVVGLVLAAMVKFKQLNAGSGLVAVLFGVLLGATPMGPGMTAQIRVVADSIGAWLGSL
jgi:hypothetical protein